jgi:hypothetical protein
MESFENKKSETSNNFGVIRRRRGFNLLRTDAEIQRNEALHEMHSLPETSVTRDLAKGKGQLSGSLEKVYNSGDNQKLDNVPQMLEKKLDFYEKSIFQ